MGSGDPALQIFYPSHSSSSPPPSSILPTQQLRKYHAPGNMSSYQYEAQRPKPTQFQSAEDLGVALGVRRNVTVDVQEFVRTRDAVRAFTEFIKPQVKTR